MGTNSEFGKEFDSLADVVSFGIAPGISGLRVGRPRDGGSEAPQALAPHRNWAG